MIATHDTELQHRIAKAWAKFGVFRSELTDKDVPLLETETIPFGGFTNGLIWKLFMGHDQRPGATTGNDTTQDDAINSWAEATGANNDAR